MKRLQIGMFNVNIEGNRIRIPSQFELEDQKVRLLLIEGEEVCFLYLEDAAGKVSAGQLCKDGGARILEEAEAYCDGSGYIRLPERFLEMRKDAESVEIIGAMDHLEIYFERQEEIDYMAILNTPGEEIGN